MTTLLTEPVRSAPIPSLPPAGVEEVGRPRRRRPRPVVLRALLVALGLAVLVLLPRDSHGELTHARLRPTRPACPTCPASTRLTGAALVRSRGHAFLVAAFAAPPAQARLGIESSARPTSVALVQVHHRWTAVVVEGDGAGARGFRAVTLGRRVAFQLPTRLARAAIAVRTADGRLVPATGFLHPARSGHRHLVWIDVLLLAVFSGFAWRSRRKGFAAVVPQLLGTLGAFVTLYLLYALFARVLRHATATHAVFEVLVLALVIAATGLGGWVAARALAPPAQRWLRRHEDGRLGRWAERNLGAAGVLTAIALAAMYLALVVDLVVLRGLYPTMQGSVLVQSLVHAFVRVFPPVVL